MPIDVYVCRKCKGATKLTGDLERRLANAPESHRVDIQAVRCQDVCDGPVAGLAVDGEMQWFERVRGKELRKALAKLARRGGRGPVPKALRPQRLTKRRGRSVRR
ncbi:hypothetical protein BH23ACT2_BH23ACT2_01400 [soil metagenome]